MSDSYIPRNDHLALEWMENLGAKLTATPGLYLVSPADAAAVTAAVNNFGAALAVLGDPAQKNKVTVAAKDDARTAAEQICRQFAMQIKISAAISDDAKISAGIRPINSNRDPIIPPSSSPVLSIFGAGYATHTLRFVDSETPDSRGKPYGVKQMQLFYHVGEAPATQPEEAKFHGLHTKSPIGIGFDPDDVGKKVTYFSRWCTIKGETGPWSAPVTLSIAA